jgi:ABC-type uncharacterized transport system substrate-binding protein
MIGRLLSASRVWLAALGVAAMASQAAAHPHVFVKAKAEVLFDAQGRMTYVRHVWQFDPAFSAFATQGLDANHDGKLEQSELKGLAHTNVTSLKYYRYFTWLSIGGKQIKLKDPDQYFLRMYDGLLTLYYQLPLATPMPPGPDMTLEIYDPEYFVAFTFDKKQPITLYHAPAGCTATYHPPKPLSASIMMRLSEIPQSQHDLPAALRDAAVGLANIIKMSCPR